MKHNLNQNPWTLSFKKQTELNAPFDKTAAVTIAASVPGNAELDLAKAGYLPEDLYHGMNILEVQKFEFYEWLYETDFSAPDDIAGKEFFLEFEGVDTLADYYLNDVKLGSSDNMMIPVRFPVTKLLQKKNHLSVHIRSIMKKITNEEFPMYTLFNDKDVFDNKQYDCVPVRKAAHSFGWDIMPRAVTSGIWRSVNLVETEPCQLDQLFYITRKLTDNEAELLFCFDIHTEETAGMEIDIQGSCKDSSFHITQPLRFRAGNAAVTIKNPHLWWPYGYGDANLYDTTVTILKDKQSVFVKKLSVGIRTVSLSLTDITDGKKGDFSLYVNNTRIICKGSSWVPMDVFHSKDASRYQKALELFRDIGCNMIRFWGGNVYEEQEVYDFCDQNGIMLWQDFGMACHYYPQDEEFLEKIRKEATAVIKSIRNHPSVVLYAGDNECDVMQLSDPNKNRITREILPQAIYANDYGRPYIKSSPYVSEEAYRIGDYNQCSEAHLWGPRDYFKSPFYTTSNAHFISETGYHGCPCEESIREFIDEEFVWPMENNPQWILHSSDHEGKDYRVVLMSNQVQQLFGEVPTELSDFILASQYSQLEADKFLIENVRVNRQTKSGILWWNLIDGWPQFSDAVVDYYYRKKLAYDVIKRSQQPTALMFGEMENWHLPLYAVNDTLQAVSGTYRVTNLTNDTIAAQGEFFVTENENAFLTKLPLMYSEKGMLLIEWWIDEKRYFNHYLYGYPAFSLKEYTNWFKKVK